MSALEWVSFKFCGRVMGCGLLGELGVCGYLSGCGCLVVECVLGCFRRGW